MLTILVYDDGRLSIQSDDRQAENIRISDAFENADETALAYSWNETPADEEGAVQMMIDAENAKSALIALSSEFAEADEALEQLDPRPPYTPGRPKQKKEE